VIIAADDKEIENWNDNNGQDGAHLNTDDWTGWERQFKKKSTLIGTAKSGANGEFNFENLINKAGGYMIFEDTEVNGYVKAQNPWILAIRTDGTYQLRHSTDASAKQDNDYWAAETYEKCDGLVLENERKPIEIYKVDETLDANKLAGATFVIASADMDEDGDWYINANYNLANNVYARAMTINGSKDIGPTLEDGKLTIENLDPGNYLLFEKTAPIGFNRVKSPWLIKVTEDHNGYSWNVFALKDEYVNKHIWRTGTNDSKKQDYIAAETLEAYPASQRFWNNSWFKTEPTTNLVNTPKHLTKVDIAEITGNNPRGLEGAEFSISQTYSTVLDGKGLSYRIKDNAITHTMTTESDGKIKLPSEFTKTEGYYLLTENIAPGGYRLADHPWLIHVKSDGEIEILVTSNDSFTKNNRIWWNGFMNASYATSYRIPNDLIPLTLTKVDAYDKNIKLGGASFKFYKADIVGTREYKFVDDASHARGTSNPSDETTGKFNLPVEVYNDPNKLTFDSKNRKYTFLMFEVDEPTGYMKSETPWAVQISYDSARGYYANAWEYELKSGTTDTYVWKYEDAYSSDDGCDDTVKNLPSINLTKVDLKTATIKYETENGVKKEVVDTGIHTKYLKGATFQLYKATDNSYSDVGKTLIKTVPDSDANGKFKSGDEGKIALGSLTRGYYLLVETAASDESYVIPSKPWRIEIDDKGKLAHIYAPSAEGTGGYIETKVATDCEDENVITNSQVFNLPKSGGMGTYWFMIIGAMMMGFALTAGFTKMNLLKLLRR